MTLDDLRKLDTWDITAILGGFLATIAPGVLIIFLYAPNLVRELEAFKLVLLASAFTIPIIAVNALALAIIGPFVGSLGHGNRRHLFFWQVAWAFLALYVSLLIAYLCSLTVGQFIGTVAIADIIAGAMVLYVMRFLTSSDP